ncbi:SUKH-4 family immunity protein [Streptomyces sp. NBC_01619]|uniref:SUKH-4 family immunity protein n=1 Tax=Streptomyces sp. NBC_01619 TaxID=2975901 RepID=UPI00225B6004|nr:SUKH-4 family immunity protein [Streptomyces sp. NBC_01619]MCX4511366.1 SUKH-4 family immunity protein [Streptomyces sp. NBC_01619]
MVTFAQAQERAEEWINGDVPAYQHREVRVREFDLGFVVWAEDRAEGPTSDGGRQRMVIARDSGEATLWPALPVGEVIRRYEEEYGTPDVAAAAAAPPPERIDLNQTSFLLSPPEWLQDAADRLGIPDQRGTRGGQGSPAGAAQDSGAGQGATGATGAVQGSGAGQPAAGAGWSHGGTGGRGSHVGGDAWPGSAAAAAAAAGSAEGAGGVPQAPGVADARPVSGDASAQAGSGAPGTGAGAAAGGSSAQVPAGGTSGGGSHIGGSAWPGTSADSGAISAPASPSAPAPAPAPVPAPATGPSGPGVPADGWPAAGGVDYEPTASDGVPAAPADATPWAGTDTNAASDDGAVPLPATVFAPPLAGADDDDTPPPSVGADAPTALMSGGSGLPRTAVAPAVDPQGHGSGAAPQQPAARPSAGDIADAATSKASLPPRGSRGGGPTTPPPPGEPGVPGARPGAPAGGYVPTQMVSQLGPEGPQPPAAPAAPGTPPGGVHHAATMLANPSQGGPGTPQPPGPPGAPGTPPGGVHHAATMLANPNANPNVIPGQGGPGVPQPPGPPGAPGTPQPPGPPGAPGTPPGGVHHAATMLANPNQGGPGAPQPPQPPGPPPGPVPGPPPGPAPAYGYPQQPPAGLPTVGPGYQAVLRYRAPDGSEQQLIRRSAPGTPHPEWQIFHELRGMNVPNDQVLELHTELESCELPGGYCARMIRETWPQARITSIAPYGKDHASRQGGMQQLLTHQGELHQVADGPARPAPVRAPLPQVQPAPPVPPEGIAQELVGAFGPQGICRFDQRAVSRQGVPEVVALTLVWAGLPADFGPFFWAQPAQPVVPTLAELAAQRQVQPASDAGSYLVVGSDFGRAICVQYGTAQIVAVPVEGGPGGQPMAPQFVNSGLPEFTRSLALLGRMWRLRFGLNPEQAGRWTVDFQAQLAALDPAALSSPESWWSVLLEQMWDGLL